MATFEMIAIVIVEFPLNESGYAHILTIIDRFSRYVAAVPLVETSTASIARALVNNWFLVHGTPQQILSDRGSSFTSELWEYPANARGFKKPMECSRDS